MQFRKGGNDYGLEWKGMGAGFEWEELILEKED